MKLNSKKAELLMASVSLAWGSSYLLMKVGLGSMGPFNLIALRFGIAFICMTPVFLPRLHDLTVSILAKGVLMGVLLFLIFSWLVCGVNHTTASTAGFSASTTVIIVPILESILKHRLPDKSIMFSSLLISIIQLAVASLLGVVSMLCMKTPALPETPIQWEAIICLGLICSNFILYFPP